MKFILWVALAGVAIALLCLSPIWWLAERKREGFFALHRCASCGHKMHKPYAIWRWQSGKPDRSYCFLCWAQRIKPLSK